MNRWQNLDGFWLHMEYGVLAFVSQIKNESSNPWGLTQK